MDLDLWTFGLPGPIALTIVAVIGYLIGRRRRRVVVQQHPARGDLKRAKAVIRDLEAIAQQVRRSLASHHCSVLQFKDRVSKLNDPSNEVDWQVLSAEAEKILKPTLQLSTEIARAYDEFRQQTHLLMMFTEVRTDPLTGLNNRRALDETLLSLFNLMARYKNQFSVAIFDIDHFKQINDLRGHLHGDEILRNVGRLFVSRARETDTIARFGGEEFVVIMPETELAGACILGERIRAAVQAESPVTVSGGVATVLDGDTPQSLLARADTALYSAKSQGRNVVYFHTGTDTQPAVQPDRAASHAGA